jgi:hypothetical protein
MNTETSYWFTHMGEIRYANERLGHHWFKPDTMRFFGCRVGSAVYGGRYFITSEQDTYVSSTGSPGAWYGRRLYTVRMANHDGSIETIGEFGAYETRAQALGAIRRILAGK